MAERRLHGLQRVLGVNALFSTAYGNVGSSIYYALGLVASFALGLTPVVFIITGFIFWLTASTYAEATAMYPEAGGSSSFARHAFNEFWSFFAAWAQMLNYTITIAISAFFVPHYLGGLFWEPLQTAPGDIIFGIGVVIALSLVNVVGVKESAGLNVTLAVIDFATQLLLVLVGLVLVFSPEVLADNVDFGIAPTWKDFFIAIPIGMIAYTGIETISNMAEEARDETVTIPKAINRVVIAVFAIYAALPAVALSALPVTQNPETGEYETKLGLPEEEGGYAGDPILGVVNAIDLGAMQSAAEIYVGLLAATILFIATNAGIIGVSRLVYSMGIHRQVPDRLRQLHPKFGTPWIGILIFGGVACLAMIPGQAEFLGNMYAFGAMLSFTIAHLAADPAALQVPRLRSTVHRPDERPGGRGQHSGVRDPGAARDRPRVRRRHGAARRRRDRGHRLAGLRLSSSIRCIAGATGSTSRPRRAWRCPSRSSSTRPSTTRCSSRSTRAAIRPAPWRRRCGWRPGGAAASTCSYRSRFPPRRRSTPRCPSRSARR